MGFEDVDRRFQARKSGTLAPLGAQSREEQEKFWFAYNEAREPADQVWPDWMKAREIATTQTVKPIDAATHDHNESRVASTVISDALENIVRSRDQMINTFIQTPTKARDIVAETRARLQGDSNFEMVRAKFNLRPESVFALPQCIFTYLVEHVGKEVRRDMECVYCGGVGILRRSYPLTSGEIVCDKSTCPRCGGSGKEHA